MAATQKSATKTSAARKIAAPAKGLDAIVLLRADHAEAKKCFKEYQKLVYGEAPAEQRKALAQKVCLMLTVHTKIEEEIFYPAAREVLGKDEDLIDEADVEHASAKDLIAQIQKMRPDDDLYDAKVKVLGEYVDHHVKEEQDEMFPKVRGKKLDLKSMGAALAARKEQLMAELGARPH